jgi:hypothetical protein
LRNDYYNGINFAYLLNVRAADSLKQANAAQSDAQATQFRADAVACFVDAQKVRDEVLKICETVLNTEKLSNDQRYWILATLAEAKLGLGSEEQAAATLTEASAVASAPWMNESTTEQLDKLRVLLADSPLRFIRAS